eukprot:768672-Hanusia_phi.AAC.24
MSEEEAGSEFGPWTAFNAGEFLADILPLDVKLRSSPAVFMSMKADVLANKGSIWFCLSTKSFPVRTRPFFTFSSSFSSCIWSWQLTYTMTVETAIFH